MPDVATPESCHDHPPTGQSQAPKKWPFLCAPYTSGKGERYQPSQSIDRCPLATGGGRCEVGKHGFRDRKTGPEIPLQILYCEVHNRYFTIYPVGHVPYGRCALAPVDLRGEPIERTDPEPEASCRGSLFEAALDAAVGQLWEREPTDDLAAPRYSTQRRRIEKSSQLLGLERTLPDTAVERIRDHLRIDGLDHSLGRDRYQRAVGLKARGMVVLDVHRATLADSSRVPRLLAAGFLSGLWGRPWLWAAARSRRICVLSRTGRALRAPP